ncbi:mannan endo-1,4-beta-mannosidase, putative [Phytophthora infestans T30-4]|uniref:mannan endo-1,4-beta-mannosidase n=3 Tax=Phytophthora infestans TaxID=4787 RepID=D0NBW0_PHYIT|nr:mannan endo-1,4-beta-mannosidase, putative [Phytophthora infestans T30-4]EEY55265.1 mannan endo-1,4-beta-mannosidase, putative [Phytophthora infestans T30-4]KAF4134861.1 Cellulase (glycosyl hydrolase family 5) [Phytophthora infestans]|eukprot:XP_002903489.1 mannan endo-1,4-beta-mannosidase, putative [Phytophthora infestans T30-4]
MKVFATAAALFASLSAHSATAGYVTTSGTNFELDGQPFYVFGTNAYWASEITWSKTDLSTIFNTMAKSDLTVCRTWGFADLNQTGTAPYNVVYQLWENGKPTVNTGDNGLGYFDQVVAAAKTAGVKLVVPFVNNWSDYGGIDVYVQQLGGKYHDDFYTDEKIKTAYKNFVKVFVTRYADEETIMAWQLCNECRCAGSGALKESGNCNAKTLTDWMTEMSAYIKSLDSNHLVASGSEGFMNTDKSVYLYSGPSGVDFDANLAIKSIDYGAYHAYPDSWGVATAEAKTWGVKWIKDHVASGTKAGKPVVLEEYGIKPLDSASYLAWSDEVYKSKSNMQYWQFGVKSLNTHDDGYAIFDKDELFSTVIATAAAKFASLGGSTSKKSTSKTASSVAGDASYATDDSSNEETEATEAPTATTATPSAVDASSDTAEESTADSNSGLDTEASADTSTQETPSGSDLSAETTDTPVGPSSDKCAVRGRHA